MILPTSRILPAGALLGCLLAVGPAQAAPKPGREAILAAARAMMTSQPYCALATTDADGRPTVRTMNPIAPEADFTVCFATHDGSRKARELAQNPYVAVYYADHSRPEGFVALHGKASLVKDMAEIRKRKRAYWDQAFPGLAHLVLVKVEPSRLEVVSYKDGLTVDDATGLPPTVTFRP